MTPEAWFTFKLKNQMNGSHTLAQSAFYMLVLVCHAHMAKKKVLDTLVALPEKIKVGATERWVITED